jgi:hypothetical protein
MEQTETFEEGLGPHNHSLGSPLHFFSNVTCHNIWQYEGGNPHGINHGLLNVHTWLFPLPTMFVQ